MLRYIYFKPLLSSLSESPFIGPVYFSIEHFKLRTKIKPENFISRPETKIYPNENYPLYTVVYNSVKKILKHSHINGDLDGIHFIVSLLVVSSIHWGEGRGEGRLVITVCDVYSIFACMYKLVVVVTAKTEM